MNAYRNYKKNQGLAKAREILDDNMDRYIERAESVGENWTFAGVEESEDE